MLSTLSFNLNFFCICIIKKKNFHQSLLILINVNGLLNNLFKKMEMEDNTKEFKLN